MYNVDVFTSCVFTYSLYLCVSPSTTVWNITNKTRIDSHVTKGYSPLSRTIKLSKFTYHHWTISDLDYPPSCTFLDCTLQLCKVSSVSVHPFTSCNKSNCTYLTTYFTYSHLCTGHWKLYLLSLDSFPW